MIIRTLPLGQLEANCYIISDEEADIALVIDPGDEPDTILDALGDTRVEHIILTHAHFDHAGAAAEIQEATGAGIIIHEAEKETYEAITHQGSAWGFHVLPLPAPAAYVKEGDEISAGDLVFSVIHTPGHSPGSLCLYTKGLVITGDTLFMGSVGRTDFPGGSSAALRESFRRLMTLPENTTVLSGHGPATTIGREKVFNMFAAQFLA